MNGLSIDNIFDFELGQLLRDSSLAVSIMGRRAHIGATGLDGESRSFCSSQDKVPFSRLRADTRHPWQIGDILRWLIFVFIQA